MKLDGKSPPNAATVKLATEAWLASLEKYGKKLAGGKFSMESLLILLESCPPEVRSNPANKFEPLRLVVVSALKAGSFLRSTLFGKPLTPSDSQVHAVGELIAGKLGVNASTGENYVAAALPLSRAVANIEPIDDRLLEQFDAQLFAMLRLTEYRKQFPPGFEERVRLAAQKNDIPFFAKLSECFSEPVQYKLESDIKDFQLSAIGTFLLKNWDSIRGWEPNYGLHQFSRKALLAYCEARLDSHEKKERPITQSAVEQARKRFKLNRSKPLLVKDAWLGKDRRGNPDTDVIILRLKKGGQIIHKRMSTLGREP